MAGYISREAVVKNLLDECKIMGYGGLTPRDVTRVVACTPNVDVVPWEVLARYADHFCALVSYPEFIREAKAFYNEIYGGAGMDGESK